VNDTTLGQPEGIEARRMSADEDDASSDADKQTNND